MILNFNYVFYMLSINRRKRCLVVHCIRMNWNLFESFLARWCKTTWTDLISIRLSVERWQLYLMLYINVYGKIRNICMHFGLNMVAIWSLLLSIGFGTCVSFIIFSKIFYSHWKSWHAIEWKKRFLIISRLCVSNSPSNVFTQLLLKS